MLTPASTAMPCQHGTGEKRCLLLYTIGTLFTQGCMGSFAGAADNRYLFVPECCEAGKHMSCLHNAAVCTHADRDLLPQVSIGTKQLAYYLFQCAVIMLGEGLQCCSSVGNSLQHAHLTVGGG